MANNDPKYKPKVENKVLLQYIPHGIDHNIFKPLSLDNQGNKIKVKNEKNVENEMTEYEAMLDFKKNLFKDDDPEFVVLFNSRNIRRKMPGDIVLAFEEFRYLVGEDKNVAMIMHTAVIDENGTDLAAVKQAISPDSKIYFSNGKLSPVQMNFLYNIADVTINISSNEGYGLSTAESIMAGTPIIVNVTGGLQDQCGFVDEKGNFLDPETDYKFEWGSNHDGKYKKHGEWVKPLFPTNRALVGSPPTPYIFDDRCDWLDAADALKYWYDKSAKERARAGMKGREFMIKTGMTAQIMGLRFIDYIEQSLEKYVPRKRFFVKEI